MTPVNTGLVARLEAHIVKLLEPLGEQGVEEAGAKY